VTLADFLVPLSGAESRTELERFRVEYEAAHGPTDLLKRYTSTWPLEQQQWLAEHEPRKWFDGLPPFAKAYFLGKIKAAAQTGKLDDVPDHFLRLFIKGELLEEGPGR